MIVLNVRYQRDTPVGLVDIHAFVVDQEEEGNFLAYYRKGNYQEQKVVSSEREALAFIGEVLGCLEVATC